MAVLEAVILISAFLAIYWVFYGQRKFNESLSPKRKTKLKAVIFDLDGVLIDSFDAWFSVFNLTRKHFKLSEFSRNKFEKKAWGRILNEELKKNFPNQDVEEVKGRYKTLFMERIGKIKLLPGSEEVLNEIKKKGIKMAR